MWGVPLTKGWAFVFWNKTDDRHSSEKALALPVVRLMSTGRGDINRARSSNRKQSKPEHNLKRIISPTSISGGMEASELIFIPLHVTHSANVN